jgi:threonylcarbamoyladenosine tRNA methylthiotransferase MtaB
MRIAFTTLGCKINQFETDVLRRDFETRGNTIVPFDAEADVYIINTCSVTAKSDYQCRQAIRSAIRRGHGAKVMVTGCYAETRPEELRRIPGVEHVYGNRDKDEIVDHILSTTASPSGLKIHPSSHSSTKTLRSRTRGFLKIQDGCDNHCSYCIVPLARGASRSVALREVLREFERLVQSGCPEVVLSGIHIGTYGSDLAPGTNLTELLDILIAARANVRIRLSSIEPGEITQELVGFLGKGLCRHLHVPLQSGDDAILASMKRTYTSGFYRELLESIAKHVPGIALGADVMVGFPGEGEKEFQNTMQLVEQSPLTHLHVFSYSPRPGTSAADMKGPVPESVKKERSEALRKLGRKKNLQFRKMHEGAELDIVVEDKVDAITGLLTGLTDNYIRAHIYGLKTGHIGKKITVKIQDANEQATLAEIM